MINPARLCRLCAILGIAATVIAAAPAVAQVSAPERGAAPMLVLDAHVDPLPRVLDRGDDLGDESAGGQVDIPKLRRGGINIVWIALWVDPQKYQGRAAVKRAADLLGALQRQLKRHSGDMVECQTAAQCRAVAAEGKIAALIGLEGGIALNNDLNAVEEWRRAGVRRMVLTWRGNLAWAGSSQSEDPSKGLNDFGRSVVREMNRVGMVVDLSHVSDQTFYDAIAVSQLPVIVSHSNTRALAVHPRNVTDDMLRTLRANGGVIGVNFFQTYLKPDLKNGWFARSGTGTIKDVLDQVDHMVKVAGVDHVGIGSDLDGDIRAARGLENSSKMPALFDGLRGRGYSETDIRKIAGGNFLRVIEANERAISLKP